MHTIEILFPMALTLYTWAIWGHRKAHSISRWMVVVMGFGLAADLLGTIFLCILSARGWVWNLHSISGSLVRRDHGRPLRLGGGCYQKPPLGRALLSLVALGLDDLARVFSDRDTHQPLGCSRSARTIPCPMTTPRFSWGSVIFTTISRQVFFMAIRRLLKTTLYERSTCLLLFFTNRNHVVPI